MNKESTKRVLVIFGVVIVAISASLTFTFFFENLPALVPVEIFGKTTAGIIAGIMGTIIFEVASLVWLRAYLHGSENNDQRTISIWMSAFDITGGALASFAQIIIAGTNLISLDPTSKYYIGIISLFAISSAVVLNFIAYWAFDKNSEVSKMAIRYANRRAKIQAAEEKQADLLDDLVAQKTGQKLAARAETLAEEAAEKRVAERVRIERGGETGNVEKYTPPTPVSTKIPTFQPVALRQKEGTENNDRPIGFGERVNLFEMYEENEVNQQFPTFQHWVMNEAERTGKTQLQILSEMGKAILGNDGTPRQSHSNENESSANNNEALEGN